MPFLLSLAMFWQVQKFTQENLHCAVSSSLGIFRFKTVTWEVYCSDASGLKGRSIQRTRMQFVKYFHLFTDLFHTPIEIQRRFLSQIAGFLHSPRNHIRLHAGAVGHQRRMFYVTSPFDNFMSSTRSFNDTVRRGKKFWPCV